MNEGEDALFVTARCIGVADGVGSWAHEKGIDAGEFSRGARLARLLPRCPPSKNVCGHDEGLAGLMNNAHAISQEAISRRAPVRRFPRLPGNLTGLVAYLATTPRATSSTRHGSQYCHAIPMRTVECITTRRIVIGCFAVCPIVDVANAAVKTSRRSTSCARAMSGWLPPFYICTATAPFEPETYTGRVGYPNCRGSKQRTLVVDRPGRCPLCTPSSPNASDAAQPHIEAHIRAHVDRP